jgi:hypothetical protein
MATIETKNLDRLIASLQQLGRMSVVATALGKQAKRLRGIMQSYPPPLPNQQYRRTGTLKAGWIVSPTKHDATGFSTTLENPVVYAPWVQGDRTQAEIHKGRWATDEQVARREEATISSDIDRTLQNEIDRLMNF